MNGSIELALPKGVNISDSEPKMVVAAKLFEMGEFFWTGSGNGRNN